MVSAVAAAVAVFVKTPELSPVKTRLAQDIGTQAARAAYEESLAAVAATLRACAPLIPYWAVGEEAGTAMHRWAEFPALWTGDGELGDRLAHIYATLRQRHGRVVLIGSDSPQIQAETLREAAREEGKIVIGPATDGGFYLFAADIPLGREFWRGVEYSRADTLENLLGSLPAGEEVQRLPTLSDMDDSKSLARVIEELQTHNAPAAARLEHLVCEIGKKLTK